MTYEEALEYAKGGLEIYQRDYSELITQIEFQKLVIKAFEKQIPMKYEIFNGQASCPNCKILFGDNETLKKLIHWNMDYCKYCGQAIDWSTDEET